MIPTIVKRAYRVGDNQDVGLGGSLGSGLGEVANDGGVGVEEVITGHTGLARNTGRDEDDLGALEGITETSGIGVVTSDGAVGVDVAQIGSNTWHSSSDLEHNGTEGGSDKRRTGSTTDIVEGELRNTGVELHQQRQRLANATGSTEHGDLGGLSEVLAQRDGRASSNWEYLAGRGREGTLLEEVERLTSSKHGDSNGDEDGERMEKKKGTKRKMKGRDEKRLEPGESKSPLHIRPPDARPFS